MSVVNLIDGTWHAASGPETVATRDPATGETLARYPVSTATDVDRAVGVVGCITPWNYPVPLAAHKIFAAVVSGNWR